MLRGGGGSADWQKTEQNKKRSGKSSCARTRHVPPFDSLRTGGAAAGMLRRRASFDRQRLRTAAPRERRSTHTHTQRHRHTQTHAHTGYRGMTEARGARSRLSQVNGHYQRVVIQCAGLSAAAASTRRAGISGGDI